MALCWVLMPLRGELTSGQAQRGTTDWMEETDSLLNKCFFLFLSPAHYVECVWMQMFERLGVVVNEWLSLQCKWEVWGWKVTDIWLCLSTDLSVPCACITWFSIRGFSLVCVCVCWMWCSLVRGCSCRLLCTCCGCCVHVALVRQLSLWATGGKVFIWKHTEEPAVLFFFLHLQQVPLFLERHPRADSILSFVTDYTPMLMMTMTNAPFNFVGSGLYLSVVLLKGFTYRWI